MATKRPLVTKKDIRDFFTLVAVLAVGAVFVLVAGPSVKALAMEHVFNPAKLDPLGGKRPGLSMTVVNVAAESAEPVSSFEWHTAHKLDVVNDGGLTLGALRLDPTLHAPADGKSTADATWVRVTQDGNLIMAETRLSEMKNLWLRVPEKGFKVGDKTTLTVELKIDETLYVKDAYKHPAPYSFSVTPHRAFQPGKDYYTPSTYNPADLFPDLGNHDTGL